MGKGDWMPFGVVAIVVVLSAVFPKTMMVTAIAWSVFIAFRMSAQIRHANRLGRPQEVERLQWVCLAFNVPAFMAYIVASLAL